MVQCVDAEKFLHLWLYSLFCLLSKCNLSETFSPGMGITQVKVKVKVKVKVSL